MAISYAVDQDTTLRVLPVGSGSNWRCWLEKLRAPDGFRGLGRGKLQRHDSLGRISRLEVSSRQIRAAGGILVVGGLGEGSAGSSPRGSLKRSVRSRNDHFAARHYAAFDAHLASRRPTTAACLNKARAYSLLTHHFQVYGHSAGSPVSPPECPVPVSDPRLTQTYQGLLLSPTPEPRPRAEPAILRRKPTVKLPPSASSTAVLADVDIAHKSLLSCIPPARKNQGQR